MKSRAVITGIGVVAPNGIGKDDFWSSLCDGESAIDTISLFNASKLKSRCKSYSKI